MIVLTGAKRAVEHLAIGPGGNILASNGGYAGPELWHLPSGDAWGRYTGGMRFSTGPVAFHPTRPLCYAPATDGIAVIETDTKKGRTARPNPLMRYCMGMWDLAPDGESFVGYLSGLGGITRFRHHPDDTLRSDWSVSFDKMTPRSRETLHPISYRAAPDGNWFVCVEGERGRYGMGWQRLRLSAREMKKGALLGAVEVSPETHLWPAIAPVGRRFVTCRENGLHVWDAADLGAKPRRVKNDSRSRFTGVAFHPSGKYLAASTGLEVKLYDTSTWQVAKTYTWKVGRMRSVAFSPDGTLAAAGSDTGKVVIWDVDV